MSDGVVVLDAGVLDRVAVDQELRWVLGDLVAGGWQPLIPTVVLAEAVTGRPQDAPINHLVRRVGTTTTDEATARRAGQLRHGVARSGVRRIPSAIDALVAAHALDATAGVVITTDPTDLRRLLVDAPHITVEPV